MISPHHFAMLQVLFSLKETMLQVAVVLLRVLRGVAKALFVLFKVQKVATYFVG